MLAAAAKRTKRTLFDDPYRTLVSNSNKSNNNNIKIKKPTACASFHEKLWMTMSWNARPLGGRVTLFLQQAWIRFCSINGFEAWRQLLSQYQPRTRARSIPMLSALMNFPAFSKTQTIIEQIQGFERLRNEYRRSSGVDLADDVSLSILVRCLPKALQQHVQLQLREDSTYSTVRSMVVAYEQTTSSWTDNRIYTEVGVALGSVGSYGSPCGAVPMEIDAVQQWKGKGKSDKGKGKGRGKFDFSKWKSKESKGKGKSDSKGKGLGKNQNSNASIACHYWVSRVISRKNVSSFSVIKMVIKVVEKENMVML